MSNDLILLQNNLVNLCCRIRVTSAITSDKVQEKQFFTQFPNFHILLLKGFNHMLKDFVLCAASVCRFCSDMQVCGLPFVLC